MPDRNCSATRGRISAASCASSSEATIASLASSSRMASSAGAKPSAPWDCAAGARRNELNSFGDSRSWCNQKLAGGEAEAVKCL